MHIYATLKLEGKLLSHPLLVNKMMKGSDGKRLEEFWCHLSQLMSLESHITSKMATKSFSSEIKVL